jgi:spore germination cell wall hydrolase CwlJ-like protein
MSILQAIAAFLARLFGKPPTQAPDSNVPPVDRDSGSGQWPPLSDFDRDVLIRTLYGEARSEPEEGQIAVIHVIRNRTKRPKRFRATPGAVAKQPWQFSCWNQNDPNLPKMLALQSTSEEYKRLGAVVDKAWKLTDLTDGADHYYADYIPRPRFAEPPAYMTTRIGRHMFFAGVA